MSSGDRELGMGRNISRRDFVQGAAAMGALACALPDGGSLLPERDSPRRPYAPAASGLRGSQPGSFEVAHRVAFQGRSDWPSAEVSDDREYDLVVVGAGVSGLAAAHFFRARNPDARVLILDNHDERAVEAYEVGVPVITGSDSGSYGVVHGEAPIDELFYLHKAGATVTQVLTSGTSLPRELWGCSSANVEKGNAADFVLLDGSPYDSLEHVRKPQAVFLGELRKLGEDE